MGQSNNNLKYVILEGPIRQTLPSSMVSASDGE